MIDNAPVGYLVMDRAGRYLEINGSLAQMYGYTRAEILSGTASLLYHPDNPTIEANEINDVLSGEQATRTWRMKVKRKDGTSMWIEIRGTALPGPDGLPIAMAAQLVDVSADVAARERADAAEADLLRRSTHDELTGLLSRTELMTRLQDALSANNSIVAVLYVDVDRFKEINDGISHAAGDQVLVEIARRLRDATRANDLVGRVGGDEFVVALLDLESPDEARRVASNIQANIGVKEVATDHHRLRVSVSMGLSDSTLGDTPEVLLQQADLALNEAKHDGRDRVALFNDDMREVAATLLVEANAIRAGVERGEFTSWFQPIVNLSTREVVGYEALARWLRPDGSIMEAKDFIVVAEEYGLITDIGNLVAVLSLELLPSLPVTQAIAVNASPSQLASAGFAEILRLGFAQGADPHRVVIELTEQALLRLSPSSREELIALCDLGVALHIDDFGTGYSSMVHLRDFPVTGIKLDQEFTADLGDSPESPVGRLAGGIAGLAMHLNADRIAEGVESELQVAILLELGFTFGQGLLFGAAAPLPSPVALSPVPPAPRQELTAQPDLVDGRRRSD